MSLDWLYTLDELRVVSIDTKQGKERLEAEIRHLPEMLSVVGVRLPKKPRILCLMAGSGIEGIAFAELFKVEVTCLDLQKRLLAKGVKVAEKRGLKLRAVSGDVRKLARHVEKGFHLVTIMGSPLAHLNIQEFDQVIRSVKKVLARGGTFFIDQADNVFRILPQYRDAFVANREPPVLNVHAGFNSREGYFERMYSGGGKHAVYKMYLWSPWIIEYMLRKNGFKKVEVKPYADPFLMGQTTLFAAKIS